MISVGSRDGREGMGLGIRVAREMDETGLEEGEACSYVKDDDSTIDLDVALSYLDEKLQDVLGHFQKDFEGGVSAENLGAKFGGYGSFLPAYQRSPVWSNPGTSPKVHIHKAPRSPNILQLEGVRHNSVVSSTGSVSATHGPASVNVIAKCEPVNKSANPSDQKTLKFRIKMCSDNFPTRKNAEIYSGLGLDISPSSSLDGSPIDTEGLAHEPRNDPDESPSTILQIMTSFPVLGGLLLSPLPDDLIELTKMGKLQGESRSGFVHKGSQQNSVILVNSSDSASSDRRVSGDKKSKSFDKNASSMELKNSSVNDTRNAVDVPLKKEAETDKLDCEELASNANIPLLYSSYCNGVDFGKGTARAIDISRVANRGGLTDKSFFDLAEEKPLEPVSTQEINLPEKFNGKVNADGKNLQNKKASFQNDDSVHPRKEGNPKAEKSDISVKADSNISKRRKSQNSELIDPQKQKAGQKDIVREENVMKLTPGKEQSSSGGKKKSKGSLGHGAEGAEVPKNDLRIGASLVHKNRKSTHTDAYFSKSELEYLRKDYRKSSDRYKVFFGDLELEQGDNEMALEEMSSSDRLKHSEVVEKSRVEFNSTSKDRLNGEKISKPSTSEVCPKEASNVAPLTGNGPIADSAPATGAPLVNEDWVCCDKCQKWRLLPLGTNPDSLPEKWLCSMLNWLPGKNRCNVSEEETTKAVIGLHQVPASASENQITQQAHPAGVLSGASWADARNFDQSHQNLGLDSLPTGGKKKHGLKDVTKSTIRDGTTECSNSTKKILQDSVESRSLNGVTLSPLLNEFGSQHLGQSSSLEGQRQKQKGKNKQLENYSDGGNSKNSKNRNKRETEKDCFETSKKVKKDSGGDVSKGGRGLSSGLLFNVSLKDQHKYNDHSKASKSGADENLLLSVTNPEDQIQMASDEGSLHVGKYNGKDALKKRKVNECQETTIAGHHLQDSRDFMEGTNENDHRKDKKARVSKSEGKETSISKGTGKTDKKGRRMKDQQLGSYKRDLESAATSSSSKVSGSHKKKANLHEVKGSPVESVSSSPLRMLKLDKFTSSRGNLEGKDDSRDAGFFATASPRCSHGENEGGNGSGIVRKAETFTAIHCGSLGSSVLDFHNRDFSCASVSKAKTEIVFSPEFATHHISNGDPDTFSQATQYGSKPQNSDQCRNEEMGNGNHYHANGSRSRKSAKGSSSRSKDKSRGFRSQFDKGKVKTSKSSNEYIDNIPSHEEKLKDERNKCPEKFGTGSDKIEKNLISKKDSTGKLFSGGDKRQNQSEFGGHVGSNVIVSQDLKQNLFDHDSERSSKRFPSDQTGQLLVSGGGKSHSLPPSGRGQIETVKRCPQPIPGSQKENGTIVLSVHASEGDDALKAPKQIKKAENQNGIHPSNSRNTTPNGNKVRDLDAPSPLRRDFSSQGATNAVKEAKDLKHLADRLKNSGSNVESTGLYFQAALKFLHGASLLESCNSESTKHGEMIQSIQMYSSTAKLCEFCAHEYEKSKDMAAAALAYKCMEVAYMRVIYSSHTIASRDRHELQTALQTVPPGESPSSSASDIDNLNPGTVDKVAAAKGVTSPPVAGNHVIAAQNRASFVRLLNFTQDVNFAMEASRKSLISFATAKSRMQEAQYKEGISSVKRALDFNFQDVEGLLRLVRLAMEVISH
ncbi:unnamed protein product [Ilex paraguariensis]|uniref:CW-type domain-containing protein n=1 Tax=Ilex paraguariensis TaxID=185542 RepID=A0ABC8UAH6_9AQUA